MGGPRYEPEVCGRIRARVPEFARGSSDAFLAATGNKLLTLKWDPSADNALNAKFGVFYAIRLQTAPLASGTYNVVSSVSTATGSQFTQNIQSVGAAVDLSLGFEYQLKQNMVPALSHSG